MGLRTKLSIRLMALALTGMGQMSLAQVQTAQGTQSQNRGRDLRGGQHIPTRAIRRDGAPERQDTDAQRCARQQSGGRALGPLRALRAAEPAVVAG